MYNELDKYINEEISYKKLCDVINIKYYTGGKAKKLQLDDVNRYYRLVKVNTKYRVVEKLENTIQKLDHRGGIYNIKKQKTNLDIPLELDNLGGVYIIKLKNDVYIGSTNNFRKRYNSYQSGIDQQHVKGLFNNGGVMSVVWYLDVEDEYILRKVEQIYIAYFKYNDEWNLINKKEETYCLSNKKVKHKSLKVEENSYLEAIHVLLENGISIKVSGDMNE